MKAATLYLRDTTSQNPWAIRLVPTGATNSGPPLVEFYDGRYMHTPPWGQFVSRYHLDTILGIRPGAGLNLNCGVPSWRVDNTTVATVQEWLQNQVK